MPEAVTVCDHFSSWQMTQIVTKIAVNVLFTDKLHARLFPVTFLLLVGIKLTCCVRTVVHSLFIPSLEDEYITISSYTSAHVAFTVNLNYPVQGSRMYGAGWLCLWAKLWPMPWLMIPGSFDDPSSQFRIYSNMLAVFLYEPLRFSSD